MTYNQVLDASHQHRNHVPLRNERVFETLSPDSREIFAASVSNSRDIFLKLADCCKSCQYMITGDLSIL